MKLLEFLYNHIRQRNIYNLKKSQETMISCAWKGVSYELYATIQLHPEPNQGQHLNYKQN